MSVFVFVRIISVEILWSVFSHIWTRKTPNTDTFHAVVVLLKVQLEIFDRVVNTHLHLHRNSHRRCSVRNSFLRSLSKFTGKHLCQSCRPEPATLLKRKPWHRCFPLNFAKFLRKPFLTEHLWATALA